MVLMLEEHSDGYQIIALSLLRVRFLFFSSFSLSTQIKAELSCGLEGIFLLIGYINFTWFVTVQHLIAF